MIHDPAHEQQLIHTILSFRNDPEAFVMFAFPWGKVGSPLQFHKGPRAWQLKALRKIKAHIEQNVRNQVDNKPLDLLKMARASGRGIGKSAFLAWISLWLFSCVIGSTVVVSANSEQQLKTKTFPEIKKWATMSINSHWFEMNIMSIKAAPWLVKNLKETSDIDDAYWYIQASLWSEENPDAYAGNHSQLGMAVLFDEASGIPSSIWPVAEGFFTDKTTHRLWFVISNPRNPNGEFFECFHKGRDQWDTEHIDARTVEENDQGIYNNIIARYGEDSDEARIEVYGKFPAQGENQFISRDVVIAAQAREIFNDSGAPLILMCDPARMGGDKAVIGFRQGKDARSIPWQEFAKCTAVQLAEYISTAADKYNVDAIFIEEDGIGGPVIDILREAGYIVNAVLVGEAATEKERYYLHRSEIYCRMRDWLPSGCIPVSDDLESDLTAFTYKIKLNGQTALEPKDSLRDRGFASPNWSDTLAIGFSKPVARKDRNTSRARRKSRMVAKGADYDIFA